MKHCPGCSETKALDQFSVAARGKFGRAYYCRTCSAAKTREYNARPERRARNAERMRSYMRGNPDQRGKDNARSRAWRASSQPANAEYHRLWRAANPDLARAHATRYRATHPEVGLAAVHRRRARLAAAECDFTAEDWADVKAEFGDACAYCLATDVSLQMDHVQAISNGGHHVRSNIVPACPGCNNSKGRKDILQFLAYSTARSA